MMMDNIKRNIIPSTLGIKMTVTFVVFGLIVGFFSMIMSTIISTHSFIRSTGTSITKQLQETYGNNPEDFLLKNIDQRNLEFLKIKDFLSHISSETHTITSFCIFFEEKQKNTWNKLYLGSAGILKVRKASPGEIEKLKKTIQVQMRPSNSLFLGQSGHVDTQIDISSADMENRAVLELEINRKGLFQICIMNMGQIFVFSIFLLIVSTVLGLLFSRRLLVPIRIFSKEASELAEGNYSKRFHIYTKDEIGHLGTSLNKMADRIETHISEIGNRIKTMETMSRIDKAVLSSISRSDLMDRVISIFSALFKNSSVVMILYNDVSEGFDIVSYYKGSRKKLLPRKSFIQGTKIPESILGVSETFIQYTEGDTTYPVPDFFRRFFAHEKSIANSPIFLSEKYLGSLIIAKDDNIRYSQPEIESITMLSDQIGVAMGSVKTFEEKERTLVGVMIALTKSIDAKSRWTAGHSERVSKYSDLIGRRLNLSGKELHILRISSLLHDIGKIGIPGQILDKPDPLTPEEYETVKKHPLKGADILSDIPSYTDILPGILYHHERWDGKGYPKGLKGDDIPLSSRIICIADVYDSVTFTRPYRKGMTQEEVIGYLKENSGKQFDPHLVNIMIEIIQSHDV